MSLPFNTINLPEPTEEELKALIAVAMQNGLIIQQLQLMVVLQREATGEERRRGVERREPAHEEEGTRGEVKKSKAGENKENRRMDREREPTACGKV